MIEPIHTLVGQSKCTTYVIGPYTILFLPVGYNIFKMYVIVWYQNDLSVVCNKLRPLFGIRSANTIHISLNGVSYIGYELVDTDITSIKNIKLHKEDKIEIMKICIFRYIIGATLNEDKILLQIEGTSKWFMSFGEVKFGTSQSFLSTSIERRWFKDVDLTIFMRENMPMLFDHNILLVAENIIKDINPDRIYITNTIMEHIHNLID